MSSRAEFVLTLSCPDRPGIVAAVSGLLAGRGCNIIESQQFGDPAPAGSSCGCSSPSPGARRDELRERRSPPLAPEFGMDWQAARRRRPAARADPVSQVRALPERPALPAALRACSASRSSAVVSNHPDLRPLTQSYGIDYHHLPVTAGDQGRAGGARSSTLVEHYRADLVVLARYMQVLSRRPLRASCPGGSSTSTTRSCRSFKGARPYHQAHARGVKLIGATAHYVTADLDEGPIIEQEVARVDHTHTPDELAAIGRDMRVPRPGPRRPLARRAPRPAQRPQDVVFPR